MSESIFIVFTRNWTDLNGKGHGFRAVSMTPSADMAEISVHNYHANKVASASKWEVAEIPASMVVQHATETDCPQCHGPVHESGFCKSCKEAVK